MLAINRNNFIAILYDVGDGIPEDDIAAYAWWLIGIGRGDDAPRANMALLEEKLSAEELATAKKLADDLQKEMEAKKQPEKKK